MRIFWQIWARYRQERAFRLPQFLKIRGSGRQHQGAWTWHQALPRISLLSRYGAVLASSELGAQALVSVPREANRPAQSFSEVAR